MIMTIIVVVAVVVVATAVVVVVVVIVIVVDVTIIMNLLVLISRSFKYLTLIKRQPSEILVIVTLMNKLLHFGKLVLSHVLSSIYHQHLLNT